MPTKDYKNDKYIKLHNKLKKRYFGQTSLFSQFHSAQIFITKQVNKNIANNYNITYIALDQFVISYLLTLTSSSNEYTIKEIKEIINKDIRTLERANNQLLNANLVYKHGRRGHYRMTPKATVMIRQYSVQYTRLYEKLEARFPGIIFKI